MKFRTSRTGRGSALAVFLSDKKAQNRVLGTASNAFAATCALTFHLRRIEHSSAHTHMHASTFFIFPTLAENVSRTRLSEKIQEGDWLHLLLCVADRAWLEKRISGADWLTEWLENLNRRLGGAGRVLFWISHTRITNNQQVKTAQIDYGVRVKWCVILQWRTLLKNILQNNERVHTYAGRSACDNKRSQKC